MTVNGSGWNGRFLILGFLLGALCTMFVLSGLIIAPDDVARDMVRDEILGASPYMPSDVVSVTLRGHRITSQLELAGIINEMEMRHWEFQRMLDQMEWERRMDKIPIDISNVIIHGNVTRVFYLPVFNGTMRFENMVINAYMTNESRSVIFTGGDWEARMEQYRDRKSSLYMEWPLGENDRIMVRIYDRGELPP